MNSVIVSGRAVPFRLKRRPRDPFFFAAWRDGGREVERSTRSNDRRQACQIARELINSYFEIAGSELESESHVTWEQAIESLEASCISGNLRPRTIQSYVDAFRCLMRNFSSSVGPGVLTRNDARRFVAARLKEVSPDTVRGDIRELSVAFRKHLVRRVGLLKENPFEGIEPPKRDARLARLVTHVELESLSFWLRERWDPWELPATFVMALAAMGCRLGELASLPSRAIREDRIVFEGSSTKGRRERHCFPPARILDSMRECAGPTWAWESFISGRLEAHRLKGRANCLATCAESFTPTRLHRWIEAELGRFRDAHPEIPRFRIHDLRGTAMSRAHAAGCSVDEASIAFGCHVDTIRKHYLSVDELAIARRVYARLEEDGRGEVGVIDSEKRKENHKG
jgi:integrase